MIKIKLRRQKRHISERPESITKNGVKYSWINKNLTFRVTVNTKTVKTMVPKVQFPYTWKKIYNYMYQQHTSLLKKKKQKQKPSLILCITAKISLYELFGERQVKRSGQNVAFYCDLRFSWPGTAHLWLAAFISITPCSSKQGKHWYNKGRKKILRH